MGVTMSKEQGTSGAVNAGFPDAEASEALASKVLEHYLKHHKIVLGKLTHARDATSQSIQDIETICAQFEMDKGASEFQNVIRFDSVWNNIIGMFRSSGVTETELQQIEGILQNIPNAIRKYYEALLTQDKLLQSLMQEIDSDEYRKAIDATRKIQAKPNLMTGLGPDVYDLKHIEPSGPADDDVTIYEALPDSDRMH